MRIQVLLSDRCRNHARRPAVRATLAFKNLKESDIEALGRTFRPRPFAQNWPIVVQNCEVSHLGLIVIGSARMVIRDQGGGERPCGQLNSGEFIIDI